MSNLQRTQNMKLDEIKNAGSVDDAINSPSQDKIAAEREKQRQIEQERRRKEAVRLLIVVLCCLPATGDIGLNDDVIAEL